MTPNRNATLIDWLIEYSFKKYIWAFYRIRQMDKFAPLRKMPSASRGRGGFVPDSPTRGFAPGPWRGLCPRSRYRLVLRAWHMNPHFSEEDYACAQKRVWIDSKRRPAYKTSLIKRKSKSIKVYRRPILSSAAWCLAVHVPNHIATNGVRRVFGARRQKQ